MKNKLLSKIVLPFLLILVLMGVSPAIASADYIDDAIDLYEKVENKIGKIPNGPTAQELKAGKAYIRAVVNGDYDAVQNEVVKGVNVSSLNLFLDALKYYAEGNYWDFGWTFGEAFACMFLQIWSGGVWDVCGTFKEIYEFCKNVYEDVILPALEWIADAGEAVGCFVLGVGCKDTPPPPLNELAFIENYYRRGCEGVKAQESSNPQVKFKYLEDALSKEAMATYNCGMVSSMGPYFGSSIVCNTNTKQCWACRSRTDCDHTTYKYASTYSSSKCSLRYGGSSNIELARKKYVELVNAKWSQHMNAKVTEEVMKERVNFFASGINDAAMAALKSEKPADTAVVEFCRSHFKAGKKDSSFQCDLAAQFTHQLQTYDFSLDSFDRWLALTKANVKSNAQYCQDEFWSKNKEKFTGAFKSVISNNGCPLAGDKFKCQSVASHKACRNLLGSVGLAGMCSVSTSATGLEASKYVTKYLKDRGSTHPCMSSEASAAIIGASGMEKAVILACSRPTQVTNCKAAYKEFSDKYNLPVQVLQCVQGPLNAQYKAHMETVKNVVAKIGGLGPRYPVESHANDPLLIMVNDRNWGEVKNNVGPQVSSGLIFAKYVQPSMDGVDQPTVWSGDSISNSPISQTMKPPLSGIDKTKPPVPDVNKPLSSTEKMSRSPALAGAAKNLDSAGITSKQQPQQKIAEGKLPPSAATSGGTAKVREAALPGAASVAGVAGLPDLSAAERVVVGGIAGAWSGTISVDAARASAMANGICQFPIEFSVRNQGAAGTGAFRIILTNNAAPGRWMRSISSVKGGGVQEVKDLVSLKPGRNLLQMKVDEAGQVTELNESNNEYRLTVNVEGSCSPMPAAPKARQGTMPGR